MTFKKTVYYFLFLSNILLTKHISVKAKEIRICKTFHDARMKDTYRECK